MKSFLILLLLAISPVSFAAQRAVTDDGRVVILNADGTWAYEDKGEDTNSAIPTNANAFAKDSGATFAVKSTKNDSVFWINPKEWTFKKAEDGSASEYKFQLKGSDLYAMAITEEVRIDLDSLANVALSNAKDAAPDARVIKKEYRTVNGKKIMYMEIVGTISGLNFRYLGYYYSDSSGTTQFLVYTGENLVQKYEAQIATFLNGFTAGQ